MEARIANKAKDMQLSASSMGLKRAITTVICHPMVGRLFGLVFGNCIPHRGARIRTQAGSDPRLNAYLFWGLYESAEIRYIERFIQPGLDVIELGASIGGVSCVAAKQMDTDNKLVCVEANPDIQNILRENIQRNAPDRDVRIFAGAISYSGGDTVEFAIGHDTLSSHIGSGASVRLVPTLTLSQLIEREQIGDYALICDIEGAEAELFNGEREAFASCKSIVIELHETTYCDVRYSIDDLITLIAQATSMPLAARYGEVCAFAHI